MNAQPRTRASEPRKGPGYEVGECSHSANLVPRACDPWEGNEGSGIIRCRKPGILAKIELRIHFNGQSDSSLKRIIPEPSFPSQGSQARGTRLSFSQSRSPSLRSLGRKRRLWDNPSLRSRRYSRARENGKLEIPPAQKRHILSSAHRMVPPILMYFIYFNYLSNSRIYTSANIRL